MAAAQSGALMLVNPDNGGLEKLDPHSAFYSEQGLIDMRTKASQTCRKAMLGQALRNVVN